MRHHKKILQIVHEGGLDIHLQAWMKLLQIRLRRTWRRQAAQLVCMPPAFWFIAEMTVYSCLLAWLMPRHPKAALAVAGASLAIATLSTAFERGLRALFRMLAQDGCDGSQIQDFARFSRWATLPFLVLLARSPQVVALPFGLLAGILTLCLVLLAAALCLRANLDERVLRNRLLAATLCLVAGSGLVVVPESAGILYASAIVGGGIFLVFFTACWLLALNLQLGRGLWLGRSAL